MILLQAYPYTHSLLRGVTSEVLPMSSYALSPTMLPLLETFLELCDATDFSAVVTFFWMSSVSWNLRPFKADFVLGNSQKSYGAKTGKEVSVPFQ
jgi:hypothetical protein